MAVQQGVRRMVPRQQFRLALLFLIALTFPVTMNYFSVYLIIEGSAQGILTSAFLFWSAFALTSLVFGRAACGYVCPLGAIQETKDRMAPKRLVNIRHLRILKYLFAVSWVGGIVLATVSAQGFREVNLLYNTESGVSVDRAMAWFTYGTVVIAVLLPAFFMGKRGFCHYFCPWGVLNMAGTKLKDRLKLFSLRLRATPANCRQCRTCVANCPMSLDVSKEVQSGSLRNRECILCGTCADNCPNGAVRYAWSRT